MPTSKRANKSSTKKSTTRDVQVQIETRGDKTLTARAQARLDALEERDNQRKIVLRAWMEDLLKVTHKLKAAKAAYRQELREVLDEIYTKYIEIEYSDMRSDFYNELRKRLLDAGYKVQANTPDAGLLIRLVWGSSGLSNASISQYAAVFHNARDNGIAAGGLVDWLKEKHTLAEAAKKAIKDTTDVRKERMTRARILILRYLEWRETSPYARLKMLAEHANNFVNPNTHLVVMLGTAIRRFDRESDYADINISHIMPPNIDIDIRIIDRLAKYIEPKLEMFEDEVDNLPGEQWAFDLEDKLWAFDVAEAEKQSINWALRQQATMYEDQQEFAKYATAYKKARLKATTAKTAKATKTTKSSKAIKSRKAVKQKP